MKANAFLNAFFCMLLLSLFHLSFAYSQPGFYTGEWNGKTWCANPPGQSKTFRFDIWIENNMIRCNDFSSKNQFRPGVITPDGKLHCSWYRTNSDARGTYVFYLDGNDFNLLHGYELTQNISCKQYGYELRRKARVPFIGQWRGNTWCANPPKQKKSFQFDIWVENNTIRCKDYSAKNQFRPGVITPDGKLHCSWYRNNSDAHGTYVFYIDSRDMNLMHGYENTQHISCKQYGYELRR